MAHADLPLFAWSPPRQIIIFPMAKRVGRIRDVAVKMLDKPTDRAASFYRNQVTESLLKQLDRTGLPEIEQDEQLAAFWAAVQAEIIRQTYQGSKPGGTVA